MNETKHTYEFANRSNSYFMGSDVVVTRDDGKSITINGKDGMVAVNVKTHGAWISEREQPDLFPLAEEINSANKSRAPEWGDFTDTLWQHASECWWDDANELAEEAGFSRVYSAGRSGGWCCIDGTSDSDWPRIAHPEDEDDREFRDNILQLLFALHANIEHATEDYHERIREAHAELEADREKCIVRGTD